MRDEQDRGRTDQSSATPSKSQDEAQVTDLSLDEQDASNVRGGRIRQAYDESPKET